MPTTPTKFFVNPFAISGDKTAIPNDTQPSGSISYSQGWGPDYALDPDTDPAAKPVDRAATNQLNFDITTALKEYQTWGVPNFISISDNNNDGPYPYSRYAYALYDDGVNGPRIFQSLINNNTNIPALNIASENFTVSGNNLIISDSTNYYTGSAVVVSTTGTLPTPLVPNTIYYVIKVSSTSIALASTLSNALNNIPITLSGSPSGTNTVTIPLTWRWVVRSNLSSVVSFTANGTFVVPYDVNQIYVSGVGGGAGGGGSAGAPSAAAIAAGGGGGGGSGEFVYRNSLTVTPGETLTISIGAAGTAGSAGTSTAPGGNGGNGGNTTIAGSFGTLTLNGGIAGAGSFVPIPVHDIGVNGVGGAQGGESGQMGIANTAQSACVSGPGGNGGSNMFGIGGTGGYVTLTSTAAPGVAGNNGYGYGSGGGGAAGAIVASSDPAQNGAAGGAGTPGFLLIEY